MENILITGARAPVALELARSFHALGYRVIVADSLRLTITRWSKTVASYYVLPSPATELESFILEVQRIIKKENISQIIPTCEEAFYFSKHRANFSCKIWVSPLELMDKLHNKWLFTEAVKDHFSVPETVMLNEFKDWHNSESYVFKPIYSRFATEVIIGKKINESSISDKEHWIAQKRIKGKEICFYSLWDDGVLKAFSSYHPLHRVGKGAGIYFENFQNQKAFEAIRSFGAQVAFTGQLSFDAIIDEKGEAQFIECNPRATSGAHLINKRLAKAFIGSKDIEFQDDGEFSIKSALALVKPRYFFSSKVRNSQDVVFRKNDLLPFFLQILGLLEITYIKIKKRSTWLQATTSDIEWNNPNKLNRRNENL